jgi:hypothetical protein
MEEAAGHEMAAEEKERLLRSFVEVSLEVCVRA